MTQSNTTASVIGGKPSHVRYLILFMLFIVTTVNYADRATLSIAGSAMKGELNLDPLTMGYIFSAFSWAYVLAQLPGGWLLDRFGSKKIYMWSIALWSVFTMLQAGVTWMSTGAAVVSLFILRFIVGLAESPSFPANGRIVAAWFPTQERGTASAIFNSAQYFAAVLFTPLMAWIVHAYSWHHVFTVMGVFGLVLAAVWGKIIYSPKDHPMINKAELDHIEQGGGLVDMDNKKVAAPSTKGKGYIKQLLTNRMLLGVYIGQFCINVITYFFCTR